MKRQVLFLICFGATICNIYAQANYKLTGKWKFIKMETNSTTFNLDNLTTSYKQFFYKQKHNIYHDAITTNDSLYIQVQFEMVVNDINRMFILFKDNNHYVTNSYDIEGNMTDKTETGTYRFSSSKNEMYTYRHGNKNQLTRVKVISLNKTTLVLKYATGEGIFTCRKVLK